METDAVGGKFISARKKMYAKTMERRKKKRKRTLIEHKICVPQLQLAAFLDYTEPGHQQVQSHWLLCTWGIYFANFLPCYTENCLCAWAHQL